MKWLSSDNWQKLQLVTKNARCKVAPVILVSMFLTDVAFSNVIGSDMQNFNTTSDGLDYVTVHSSKTLEPGYFNLGLFMNYAKNSLPYFKRRDGTDERVKYDDSLLAGELNVGYGLMKNWELGISLPSIISQSVNADGYHGQFADNGFTDVRANTKYRLWGGTDYGIATILSTNVNLTKDNPYVGKSTTPIVNLELAGDVTISKISLAANVGYRFRNPGDKIENETPLEPLKDMFIASAAASYLLSSSDTKLIFEVYSSCPMRQVDDASDRLSSSAEANLGIKHDINRELAFHFGGGAELQKGIASPDWRVYSGITWTGGPNPEPETKPVSVEPAKKADPFAGPPKKEETIVVHDILFEFDSDRVVLPGSYGTLDRLAKYLNETPVFKKVIIEGHTDSVGPASYNRGLSFRRAQSIKAWIVKRHNLDPKKIIAVGYGESQPVASNGNYQGRQLNRRVEFKIFR